MITLLHFLGMDAKEHKWTNYLKGHLLTDGVVQKEVIPHQKGVD